jgi:hypothetical protein
MSRARSGYFSKDRGIPCRRDRHLMNGDTEGDVLAISINPMDFRIFSNNIVTQALNTTVPNPNHGGVNAY